MKRWQTRGEVQDSDEEELGLEELSQSPEHPRKKVKVDQPGSAPSQNADQIQAGRPEDALPVAEEINTIVEDDKPAENLQNLSDKGDRDQAPAPEKDDEPIWTNPVGGNTYGRLQRITKHKGGNSRDLVPVITQAEQNAVDMEDVQAAFEIPSSGSLPQNPVARSDNAVASVGNAGSMTPRATNPEADDNMSISSSPLSELSDPPDSPPAFLDMPESTMLQTRNANPSLAANQPDQIIDIDGHGVPSFLLTQRRSLRARQEKQLHPYMYDKAQYQQQCRERGLRPVRLMDQAANETQDASLDKDSAQPTSSATRPSSSSSSFGGLPSSGVHPDESFDNNAGQVQTSFDDDDLPDVETLLRNREHTALAKKRKRQKVLHRASSKNLSTLQSEGLATTEDVFAVPPSPPLSSRGSAPTTAKSATRLQVASWVIATARSDEDTPPRTARRLARVRSAIAVPSDTPSESGSESESENDQRALLRERRRIKGVLPASWLNIDRKARPGQQPPSAEHPDHRPPATQSAPQKGVARKIQKRSTTSAGQQLLEISDGGESSHSDNATPTAQPPRLPLGSEMPTFSDAHNDPVDSDDMEVDWVDPMFAGGSRGRSTSKPKGKRQPRVTNTTYEQLMPDFSEERNGLRQMQRSKPTKQRRTTKPKKPASRQTKRPPRLSILDAPKSPTAPGDTNPQFVRLAARQARHEPDRGRHSPSGKIIRLATDQDTEQANSTLESWKQGRITERLLTHAHLGPKDIGGFENARQIDPRTPLTSGPNRSVNRTKSSVPRRLAFNAGTQDSREGRANLDQQQRLIPQRAAAQTRSRDEHQHNPAVEESPRRPLPARTIKPSARYRGAQLETPEIAYFEENRSSAFQRRMQCLTETVARRTTTPAPGGLQMARFLRESGPVPGARNATSSDHIQPQDDIGPQLTETRQPVISRRPRKRRAQRIDVEARQYRQPSEPLPIVVAEQETEPALLANPSPVLRGLGPSGTRYATDFDIRHLPSGTYFHQSTFIGSGDFAAALALGERNMERASGNLRIYINGVMHEWTSWSEEVSTAMSEISPAIGTALQTPHDMASSSWDEHVAAVSSNVEHMLRSTVRYLSSCLYFLDAIDRKACCQRLDQVINDFLETIEDNERWIAGFQNLRRRMIQYALILARQNQIISDDSAPSKTEQSSSGELVRRCASRLAACLVPGELDVLRSAYEEQRFASTREHGIRSDDSTLAGVTILYHCLRTPQRTTSLFWEVIGKVLGVDPTRSQNAPEIDTAWYNIFTLLPCLDFDSAGLIQHHANLLLEADWTLPNLLIERCLKLYPTASNVRGTSVNEYVRAALTRCSCLFTVWRWWNCEKLLATVYDFFKDRGLGLLHREESKGSPDFLNNLTAHHDLSLDLEPNDPSFTIFLKIVAAALRTWKERGLYKDKKIGAIAWRILPNHARSYRKDAEVRQTDLDALRNHYDLLCTLYFASPPSHRVQVDTLRNLVDHSISHREACRISVRAWSRLASFQTSTTESTDALEPFVGWFKDMIHTTIAQYRFARTEAEQQYAEAKAQGSVGLSDELLERTVAGNQRQIAATIVDLLAAFRRALTSASSIDSARAIIEGCEPWRAFDSFDPAERRLMAVFNEALDLIKATIDVQDQFRTINNNHDSSEDSQDYGDFSLLQDFATGQSGSQSSDNTDLVVLMHDACAQLLSNAFGSEFSPDDGLLARLVDIWIHLANYMVRKGLRSWSNFVNDYHAGAWYQLRDTTQHRKFTSYVLAKILENDPDAFHPLKQTFLAAWLKSLVERESTLKYQHLLTAALLNVQSKEPLLQNLPFSRVSTATSYQITMQELRQGRLDLISTVLSNMLQQYDRTLLDRPHVLPELRRGYSDLLRQLMQAMKSNYQDLQLGSPNDTADSNVQGAYVVFVQQVVTFLQQYTNDHILPVDKFFLDSSAFPLPAADPTYVVGRLRSNGSKLGEAKTRKKVATFLHAVSERAALDGQQVYLADQFYKAMAGTTELGDVQAPSLRHVILTSIFPIYIEKALEGPCAWILALPILEASCKTVADLLYDTALNDENSIVAAREVMGALLGAVQTSIAQPIMHEDMLKSPHVLKTTAAMLELCRAAVVFAHHVQRSSKQATSVLAQLRALENQSIKLEELLTRTPDPDDFFFEQSERDLMDIDDEIDAPSAPTTRWPETEAFSARQLQQSMANEWLSVDADFGRKVFVRRGNTSKEVVVQVGTYQEEKEGLLRAIAAFGRVCYAQRARGGRWRGGRGRRGDFGLGELVI
ncbi:hypothetical protein Q7P37_003316 [Cladosporium fusiforme]